MAPCYVFKHGSSGAKKKPHCEWNVSNKTMKIIDMESAKIWNTFIISFSLLQVSKERFWKILRICEDNMPKLRHPNPGKSVRTLSFFGFVLLQQKLSS